jgi:hypothetical protein
MVPEPIQDSVLALQGENARQIKPFSTILFRYRLLDILANVLDVPRHPSLHNISRVPHPKLPDRMLKVSQLFNQQLPC